MTAIADQRRPYRPQAHPARRGRWSAPAIVDALREWAAVTGRPPRRDEWSGERPERASDAQRLWMREHPRWPSSSCVTRHFGSWSAALEAAGLRARRLTFPTTVAERVAEARALAAAGHGAPEIAGRLGVSRSTAPTTTSPPATARAAARRSRRPRPRPAWTAHATSRPSRASGRALRRSPRSATGRASTGSRRPTTTGPRTVRTPAAGRPRARAGRARPRSAASTPPRRSRG